MPEIMHSYETVFIISLNQGEEGIAALVKKFTDLIAANGTVESVDEWGKRKFAYLIDKQPEGYYTLINFKSGPEFTAELDRIFKITDGILRSMIIKKDERKVKPQKAADKASEVEEVKAQAEEAAPVVPAEEPAEEATEA